MSRDRVLWLLVAVAAFVRFWQIRGDLPYVLHYDEPTLVDNAVWMIQQRTLNPHFFNYPSGLIMLLALLYGFVCLGGIVTGQFADWVAAITWLASGTYPQPEGGGVLYYYPTIGVPALYIIGRSVSALAGVAAVVLVYALVTRARGSRGTARTAALLTALSPLAVENSHLITTDMTATALATAGLLACLETAQRHGTRGWVIAGALAGTAAGVKYNAGLVALLLPLLAVWQWRTVGKLPLRRLAFAAVAAIVAFLITTPYAVLDTTTFLRDLGYEFRHIASATPAIEGGDAPEISSVGKVAQVFWHDLGIAGILAVVLGILVSLRSRRFDRTAIACWVLVFLLPLLRWKTLYPRYLLPVWPAVLIVAALGLEAAVRFFAGRVPARAQVGVAVLIAGLVLAPGTVRLVQRESRRARPDPRIEMTVWLSTNLPQGERVVAEKGGPFPKPELYGLQIVDFIGRTRPDEYLARGLRYLVATGRERFVDDPNARAEIVKDVDAIRNASDVVWSRDRYTIFRLRGEASWEQPVRDAIIAGDLPKAREILERQAQEGAASSHLWRMLGEVSVGLRDTTAAIRAYSQAAIEDSTDVETYLVLSGLQMEARRYDLALANLERALRCSPREVLIYHNLAVLRLYRAQDRLRRGDRAAARSEWEAAGAAASVAVRAAPQDPQMTGVRDQVERMGRRWSFAK